MCIFSRFSCVQLFATLWTVTCQALVSVGFPRHEYWSGLSFPTPGDLPDLVIEPITCMQDQTRLLHLLHWQADSLAQRHLLSC